MNILDLPCPSAHRCVRLLLCHLILFVIPSLCHSVTVISSLHHIIVAQFRRVVIPSSLIPSRWKSVTSSFCPPSFHHGALPSPCHSILHHSITAEFRQFRILSSIIPSRRNSVTPSFRHSNTTQFCSSVARHSTASTFHHSVIPLFSSRFSWVFSDSTI